MPIGLHESNSRNILFLKFFSYNLWWRHSLRSIFKKYKIIKVQLMKGDAYVLISNLWIDILFELYILSANVCGDYNKENARENASKTLRNFIKETEERESKDSQYGALSSHICQCWDWLGHQRQKKSRHEICQVLVLVLLSNRFLTYNIPRKFRFCAIRYRRYKVSQSKTDKHFMCIKHHTIYRNAFQRNPWYRIWDHGIFFRD